MRVVIAEDQFLLREGLTRLLGAHGLEVVAAVEDGPGILDAHAEHRPDLMLLDIRLPPGHRDEGLQAALRIRRADPAQPIVLLSQYVERLYVDELMEKNDGGGLGYLLKDRVFDAAGFVGTLRHVASGATVMDPEVVDQMLAAQRHENKLARLSPRELETLTLMAKGESNEAIALAMVVTPKAVAKNINQIFTKLELSSDLAQSSRRVRAVLAYLRA